MGWTNRQRRMMAYWDTHRKYPSTKGHRKGKKFGPHLPPDRKISIPKSTSPSIPNPEVSPESSSHTIPDLEPEPEPESIDLGPFADEIQVLSDTSKRGPSDPNTQHFVTFCPVFTYQIDHFDRICVPGDGNCFCASLLHFIKLPHPPTVDQIRQTIVRFYETCKAKVLRSYLGCSPFDYASANQISEDGIWAEDTEILAAATLFQRKIYLFRRQSYPNTGYDVYEFSPMFQYRKVWDVFGVPEMPIVLVCTKPSGWHFDALLLKGPAKISKSSSLFKVANFPQKPKKYSPSNRNDGPPILDDFSPSKTTVSQPGPSITEKSINDKKAVFQKRLSDVYAENARLNGDIESLMEVNDVIAKRSARLKVRFGRQHRQLQKIQRKNADLQKILATRSLESGKVVDPSELKIRRAGSTGGYKHYFHIPLARFLFSKINGGTRRMRVTTFEPILDRFVGGVRPTEKEKAAFLALYFKRNDGVLRCLAETSLPQFISKLTPSQAVDIVFRMGLSWNQARILSQLLASYNVNPFPSERKIQQELTNRKHKAELREDVLPMRECKDGQESFVDRCCVRAPNLIPYVKEMYGRMTRYSATMNHKNFGDQIWLAIGGDRGGDSTKIVFSFGNVLKPCRFDNLNILAVYHGDESEVNLRRVLSIYESEWKALKSLKLPAPFVTDSEEFLEQYLVFDSETGAPETTDSAGPGTENGDSENAQDGDVHWPVRVFLFGDLLFLGRMLGLAGSSSSAPCVFCTIRQDQLRKIRPGTLQNLTAPLRDLSQWDEAIRSGEKAMQKLGIKSKPVIPVEMCDIVPPSLHIMLGIGTDLINRIEESCYRRDLSLGADVNANKEYRRLCKLSLKKESECEEATQRYQETKQILDFIIADIEKDEEGTPKKRKRKDTCAALICLGGFFEGPSWIVCGGCGARHHLECCQDDVDGSDWSCPTCQGIPLSKEDIRADVAALCHQLKEIQGEMLADLESSKKRRDEVCSVVKTKEGPWTKAFDKALHQLGVDRQAFEGGLLIGGHIRKVITGEGPKVITHCMQEDESDERGQLSDLLSTLGRITDLMCAARFLTDEEIDRLAADCKHFGEVYEKLEGEEISMTPKMHVLLHHVPDFARRNKTVGLISEHGLESLHGRFNKLGRRFACFRNGNKRMHAVIKQHVLESTLSKMRHEGSQGEGNK